MRYLLPLFISLFFIFLSPTIIQAEELVTVKLINYVGNPKELDLHIQGTYFTTDPTLFLQEGVNYHITAKNGKFIVEGGGSKYEMTGSLVLVPEHYDTSHYVSINNRPYLGAMEIRLENNHLRPVNQLLIEDYLKGVVPYEVSPSWNQESLKAQTLAARTYTYTHYKKEMDDTTRFQVYGGYKWYSSTTKAVEETRGEVITYNNQLIEALYSSSNGGITENNANVWGGTPYSYFPIKQDPYDPINPWELSIYKTQIDLDTINWDMPNVWEQLEEKDSQIAANMKNWLNNNGYGGEIKILSIPRFEISNQRNQSNRAIKGSIEIEFLAKLLEGTILYHKLSLQDVPVSTLRSMIGGTRFKSFLTDSLNERNEVYTLKGKGYGHGVGMSQWGAYRMGLNGKTYQEILQFYFPGTKIKQLY
jgi:stage II sporulation protein D